MSTSRISVVVLTRNRVREVVTTVARLLELPGPPPILIADDGSEDHTVSLLASLYPGLHVVQDATRIGVPVCNRAAALVSSDYIAFTDDDLCWESGALDYAVQLLDAHPQVAILAAHVSADGSDEAEAACAALHASALMNPLVDPLVESRVHPLSYPPMSSAMSSPAEKPLPGPLLTAYLPGACVFRASVFRALGGYEARLRDAGADDLLALDTLAAGHAIVYCEALRARRTPCGSSPHVAGNGARSAVRARNAAWIAWLRLPQWLAWWVTLRALAVLAARFAWHREAWPLVRGIVWAWRHRQPLPAPVREMRRRTQAAARRCAARTAATAASHHEDLRA